ncbi:MAG: DUF6473 family protein [Planctomycetota bacterium]
MSLYQDLDREVIDYQIYRLPGVDRNLRGPRIDLSKPFIACIGAAQTFGRFCPTPFPELLSQKLGCQVLNLAIGGCGPEMYLRPELFEVLNRANLVVAQVLSGRSASNSIWRSDRGDIMGTSLPDGRKLRQEEVFQEIFAGKRRADLTRVAAETRRDFIDQYSKLFDLLDCPKILFWFAKRTPDYVTRYDSMWGLLSEFPHLVDRATIDSIRPHAEGYVECVTTRGLPQRLWRADVAVEGTVREADGFLYNRYYPSPEMHEDAAAALAPVCPRLWKPAQPSSGYVPHDVRHDTDPSPTAHMQPSPPTGKSTTSQFLVLGPQRSGTTVTYVALRDHPQVCGLSDEVDPVALFHRGVLVYTRSEHVNPALRPIYIPRLFEAIALAEATPATRAGGMKSAVSNRAEAELIVEALLGPLRHVKLILTIRTDLIAQFGSLKRAQATNEWHSWRKQEKQDVKLELSVPEFLGYARACRDLNDLLLGIRDRRDDVLLLNYESDILGDPRGAASKLYRFVGVDDIEPVWVKSEKVAPPPEDFITNIADLRRALDQM